MHSYSSHDFSCVVCRFQIAAELPPSDCLLSPGAAGRSIVDVCFCDISKRNAGGSPVRIGGVVEIYSDAVHIGHKDESPNTKGVVP
jgi:hypothetical protein